MQATQASKYRTTADVRRVLVRHWLDLDALVLGVHRGALRLSGELRPLNPLRGGKLDGSFLEALEAEIRRIPAVRRVHFDLQNWRKDSSGTWNGLDRETAKKPSGAGTTEERPTSFTLTVGAAAAGTEVPAGW